MREVVCADVDVRASPSACMCRISCDVDEGGTRICDAVAAADADERASMSVRVRCMSCDTVCRLLVRASADCELGSGRGSVSESSSSCE